MSEIEPTEASYPIGVVSRRTGLKPDLVRVWERRYDAVTPRRSDTGRRLYSESDVARLELLSRVTAAGHPIGDVANLPESSLRELVAKAAQPAARAADPMERAVEACLGAVRDLDPERLRFELEVAAADARRGELIGRVLTPLMERIGEGWRGGELGIAHEHLATAAVREFLALRGGLASPRGAPRVVVAAPGGQRHEIGALLCAVTAALEGWAVRYLGADLPGEEIAGAAEQVQARAVVLSIARAGGEPSPVEEVRTLRRRLPGVPILAGGRGVEPLRGELAGLGVEMPADFAALRRSLARLSG